MTIDTRNLIVSARLRHDIVLVRIGGLPEISKVSSGVFSALEERGIKPILSVSGNIPGGSELIFVAEKSSAYDIVQLCGCLRNAYPGLTADVDGGNVMLVLNGRTPSDRFAIASFAFDCFARAGLDADLINSTETAVCCLFPDADGVEQTLAYEFGIKYV